MLRTNPFRPGSIAPVGMFAGRYNELCLLQQILIQTKNRNPHHFLLHGERGIGKSSLLFYFDCIASGKFTSIGEQQFKFLTLSVELEKQDAYVDLIRKIGMELSRRVRKEKSLPGVAAKTCWDFVKKWEVLGVKYNGKDSEKNYELLEELTEFVADTARTFEGKWDGIVISIDEADKSAMNTNLGEFVKLFTERLTKRECESVSLVIAGLSTIIDLLRQTHESAPRIFEVCHLEPLREHERVDVITRGMAEANRLNEIKTEITNDAIDLITMYSEGYPHFIQQFAYCAFAADQDCIIDRTDVLNGAWAEGGAFMQLGTKYYRELYFDKIGSDEYRAVLQVMARKLDDWSTKEEIRSTVKIKATTLNNALSALKKNRIIIPRPGKQGEYRLPTKSFAAWIKAYTSNREGGSE